jgi:hypothetical protein
MIDLTVKHKGCNNYLEKIYLGKSCYKNSKIVPSKKIAKELELSLRRKGNYFAVAVKVNKTWKIYY